MNYLTTLLSKYGLIKQKSTEASPLTNKREEAVKQQYTTYLIVCVCACFYVSCHIAQFLYPKAEKVTSNSIHQIGNAYVQKPSVFEAVLDGIQHMIEHPFALFPVSWKVIIPFAILSVCCGIALILMYYKEKLYQTTLPLDQIQGSAKFFPDIEKDFAPKFTAPYEPGHPEKYPFDPNIILADGLKLNLDNKKVNRNMNQLIIGGPGTGKSFNVIKPNLMQFNCSTITTDPSGELLMACGKAQLDRGIHVKLFSTSDMTHSNRYNPFDYIYDENGDPDDTKISTMVYLFLNNADGAKKNSGDQFWTKSAKALLTAIAYYLVEETRFITPNQVNFAQVLNMVQMGKVSEGAGAQSSDLDKAMEGAKRHAEAQGKSSKAWNSYATFKLAPEKTANSILISCAVDLDLFNNAAVKTLTSTDLEDDRNNLHLERLGYEQTALYINIPQANGTFNFLVSMMYSQLFDALYTQAEKVCPNRFMIMSEFNYPILAGFKTEEEAKKVQEKLLTAEIKERKNKHGAVFYTLKSGNKILAESPSLYGAERIKELAKKARVIKGSEQGGTRLPWHVRCLMDEFANIGEVPEFAEKLTTMRKYEISCTIVVQSISQLKSRYKDSFETIIGGCDTIIFLGSSENDTCEYISKLLGDTTVRTKNLSLSSRGGSSSFSYQKRALRTPSEVKELDNKECYIFIRGLNPFHVKKFNFLNHEHFNETGHKGNEFTLEMLDKYFNLKEKKKNNIKTRQKAVAKIPETEVKQPKNEQEVLDTCDAKTVEEAKQKVVIPPESKKNMQNMESKTLSDGTKALMSKIQEDVEISENEDEVQEFGFF